MKKISIKKGLVFGMLLILITVVLTILPVNVSAAGPWHVDAVNGNDANAGTSWGTAFATIGKAVSVASPGDTIYVGDGTYNENVVIKKTLTLIGNGTSVTTIDGGGNGDVIRISDNNSHTDYVNITGFTITNSGNNSAGINLTGDQSVWTYYVRYCKIYNVICINNGYGINLYYADYNTIGNSSNDTKLLNNSRNSIRLEFYARYNIFTNIEINQITTNYATNHDSAILFDYYGNYYNEIDNTTILNNYDNSSSTITYSDGIEFKNGNRYNEIRDSEIKNTKNGIYFYGTSSYQNIIERNKIHLNKENGIYFNKSEFNRIQLHKPIGSDSWGIFDNDKHGVYIREVDGNVVNDNFIYDNNRDSDSTGDGIYVEDSSDEYNGIVIEKNGIYNTASGNQRYGIHLYNTSDAFIQYQNTNYNSSYGIYKNKKDGIFLDSCVDPGNHVNQIRANCVYENEDNGIHLLDSDKNKINNESGIERNKIYDNKKDGILLEDSDNNTMVNNLIYNTGSGTQQHGIHLKKDTGDGTSTGNLIRLNNSIHDNEEHGIYIEYGNNNEINGSSLYDNNKDNDSIGDGVRLKNSDDCLIKVAVSDNSDINGGNQSHGIYLTESDNNYIFCGNILDNKDDGIYLDSKCDSNIMESVSIHRNEGNGIFLEGTSIDQPKNNEIRNSGVSGNSENGIYLKYCGTSGNGNKIKPGNYIGSNDDYGIKLEYSDHNEIEQNSISDHDSSGKAGIYLYYSDDNTIKENDIGGTNYGNYYGIYLENSDDNTITDNEIKDNDNYGINVSDYGSARNKIYHNDFIDNNGGGGGDDPGAQAYDDGDNTQWDNGYTGEILDPSEGGNYWNDHDEEGEGVWDQYQGSDQVDPGNDMVADLGDPEGGKNPYYIDGGAGAYDEYPFITPQT